MNNSQTKNSPKKQEELDQTGDRSGKNFERKQPGSEQRDRQNQSGQKESVNPDQKMRREGFDYERI